jgi:hypothetical protein
MTFADAPEQYPCLPASLIRINHPKLTDPKLTLSLIARTVSQNELHLPGSVDLGPEAADVGIPTSAYGKLSHDCIRESEIPLQRRSHIAFPDLPVTTP